MGRYDWLYELRPQPIKEVLIGQLAKILAEQLAHWPPEIEEWDDAVAQARFAPLYSERHRPRAPLYRHAFHLTKLELQREYEAIDHEMRNETWRAHADHPQSYEALQLLIRWLVDVLLAIKERANQNITRPDLVRVLEAMEPLVAPSALRQFDA